MIFVFKMLFTFVYDRKNENHWSLLIIRYSLLITRNTNTPEYHNNFNLITGNNSIIGAIKSMLFYSYNTWQQKPAAYLHVWFCYFNTTDPAT